MKRKFIIPVTALFLAFNLVVSGITISNKGIRLQNDSVSNLKPIITGADVVQPSEQTLNSIALQSSNGYRNTYDRVLKEDGFIYGMDYAWIGDALTGHKSWASNDLFGNPVCLYQSEPIRRDLYNIKALGFNCVNIWIMADGSGIKFDKETGKAIGIYKELVDNLQDTCKIARELGITLLINIQPHGEAGKSINQYNEYTGGMTTEEVSNKYFRFYYEPEAKKAYMENVIEPVCQAMVDYQDVILALGLLVENGSQRVDDPEHGYYLFGSGTTVEKMDEFINEMNSIVKKWMPTMMTSVEDVWLESNLYRYNSTDIDLHGRNTYNMYASVGDMKDAYSAYPSYISEFNLTETGDRLSNDYWVKMLNEYITNAKKGGFIGAFYYSWMPYNFSLFVDGNAEQYDKLSPAAVNFAYEFKDWKNEYKNTSGKLDDPVLLYNVGSKDVYWISTRGESITYSLERSDDNGKTWKTVSSRIDGDQNTLSNGLVKYTDESIEAGTPYCFRVTAHDTKGNSARSDRNNSTELFVPVNLFKNGSFEEECTFARDDYKRFNDWISFAGSSQAGIGKLDTNPANARTGNKSIIIDHANGIGSRNYDRLNYNFKLEPGKSYKLSYWIKFETKNVMFASSLRFSWNFDLNQGGSWPRTDNDSDYIGEWIQATINFTAPNDGIVTLSLTAADANYDPNNDMLIHLDDFELYESR